jgi:hypothetical protein
MIGSNKSFELREFAVPYEADFAPKNEVLRLQYTYYSNNII